MSCCFVEECWRDPANDKEFTVLVDYEAGTRTAYDPTNLNPVAFGSSWVRCPTTTGLGLDRFDVDYCLFDTGSQLPSRPVYCGGALTVNISAILGPVGGDETFNVAVDGVAVGSVILLDGQTTATGGSWPVTEGQLVRLQPVASTATQPSSGGSAGFAVECDGVAGGGGGPVIPVCSISQQPQSITGNVGDAINLGGAVTGGTLNWQTSTDGNPPWTATAQPTSINQAGVVFFRFCASCDPAVCSTTVTVEGQSSIFDPTTPTGNIETQGNNIVDTAGNRITGGGANVGINQRTSGN